MYIRRRISASLHTVKAKVGKQEYHLVRIRVSCNGNRIDLNTGISVTSKSQWNKKREEIKQGCFVNGVSYNELNNTLSDYEKYIHQYFTDCEQQERIVSLPELKRQFEDNFLQSRGKKNNEFFHLFDDFISEQLSVKGWGKDMVEAYQRLRNKLYEFNPNLRFIDLSTATMEKIKYLLSKSMYNDSLLKRLSYLKTFVKWAKAKKYPVNEEFFSYSPKLPKAQKAVRYLTEDEVENIYRLKLDADSAMEQTRDFFVFQCDTALRYSDIKQLTTDKIVLKNGRYYIRYLLTQKDKGNLEFALTDRATEIFLKYSNKRYDNNRVFPVLSNQKYNEHLKKLGELANLQGEWIDHEFRLQERVEVHVPRTHLSSHDARRTFVVTALNLGVPEQFIMEITDHSDLKAMRPYMKITSKGTDKLIDTFNQARKK